MAVRSRAAMTGDPAWSDPGRADGLPGRSEWLCSQFRRYAKRYLARNFHAVRLSRSGPLPALPPGPLIVVLNHPAWWDPLVGLLISGLIPDRRHFAPIDAGSLARYRFMERLGFFGVESGTIRGGRSFLGRSLAIVARADSALWITAQGRFADPRERPTLLRPGVGHLVQRLDRGTILPLALEYPFWGERLPEALARFGEPLAIEAGASPGAWTARIARALEESQDILAGEAIRRIPDAFEVLVRGGAGVGGIYDGYRRLRATLRGERFQPEHDSVPRPSPPCG